jgi:hypothetical protein
MAGKQISVYMAMPSANANVKTFTLLSIFGTTIQLMQAGHGVYLSIQDRAMVIEARNILTTRFLVETKCSHLLFVDNDMSFDGALVMDMLAQDKDVIGATCTRRELDLGALNERIKAHMRDGKSADDFDLSREIAKVSTYNYRRPASGELTFEGRVAEVDSVGTGLMLIKREPLQRMVIDGVVRPVQPGGPEGLKTPVFGFFNPVENPSLPGTMLSEDYSFCHRMRNGCGRKIYALLDCDLGHIGDFTFRGNAKTQATEG